DQTGIDQLMIELDGTPHKAKLGANAISDKAVRLTCEQSLGRRLESELYESVGFLLAEHIVKTVAFDTGVLLNI
ncbi:hypothetical protein B4Q13_25410, partial [Lacticaseibacillus rhamnosus]